jgi:hypothetical protein
MKRLWLFVAITIAQGGHVATTPAVVTHCAPTEQVIFSCETPQHKVVSLCASSPLTSTSGYMQYRFGKTSHDPEFVYPATQEHPKHYFQSGTLTYAGGGGAYMKFSNGEYTYVVFTGIGRGWAKEGVVVEKSGKQLAYLSCQGAWTSEIGPVLFEQAAIPQDPSDFAIP